MKATFPDGSCQPPRLVVAGLATVLAVGCGVEQGQEQPLDPSTGSGTGTATDSGPNIDTDSSGSTDGDVGCDPGESREDGFVARYDGGQLSWAVLTPEPGATELFPLPDGGFLLRSGAGLTRFDALGTPGPTHHLQGDVDVDVDAEGRVFHVASVAGGIEYGAFDMDFQPLWAPKAIDAVAGMVQIVAARDGTAVLAAWAFDGGYRTIHRLGADGSVTWTAQLPGKATPDEFGTAQIGGMAVMAGGEVALAYTSGALYEGGAWLDVFSPDGTPIWSATEKDVEFVGLAAPGDELIIGADDKGRLWFEAFTELGGSIWSHTATGVEGPSQLRRCRDDEVIVRAATGIYVGSGPGLSRAAKFEYSALGLEADGDWELTALALIDSACAADSGVFLLGHRRLDRYPECAGGSGG